MINVIPQNISISYSRLLPTNVTVQSQFKIKITSKSQINQIQTCNSIFMPTYFGQSNFSQIKLEKAIKVLEIMVGRLFLIKLSENFRIFEKYAAIKLNSNDVYIFESSSWSEKQTVKYYKGRPAAKNTNRQPQVTIAHLNDQISDSFQAQVPQQISYLFVFTSQILLIP